VRRFPRLSVALVAFFLAAELVARLWPGPREAFLVQVALNPSHWRASDPAGQGGLAWIFHPNLWSLGVTLVYLWVFTGRLFERRPAWLALPIALGGTWLSIAFFARIYPTSVVPVLCPEAFVGVLLGMEMRREIWSNVYTLVIGPGWIRLLDVPSYVLLFFWFFYLLIGNLALPDFLGGGPMPYALSMFSFLFGFAVESALPDSTSP